MIESVNEEFKSNPEGPIKIEPKKTTIVIRISIVNLVFISKDLWNYKFNILFRVREKIKILIKELIQFSAL